MHCARTLVTHRCFWLAVGLWLAGFAAVGQAQHLVIGLDNKIDFNDAGQQVPRPPGKDVVVIVGMKHQRARGLGHTGQRR